MSGPAPKIVLALFVDDVLVKSVDLPASPSDRTGPVTCQSIEQESIPVETMPGWQMRVVVDLRPVETYDTEGRVVSETGRVTRVLVVGVPSNTLSFDGPRIVRGRVPDPLATRTTWEYDSADQRVRALGGTTPSGAETAASYVSYGGRNTSDPSNSEQPPESDDVTPDEPRIVD